MEEKEEEEEEEERKKEGGGENIKVLNVGDSIRYTHALRKLCQE